MNAPDYNGSDDREIGTVSDHPAEEAYQHAADEGMRAVTWLRSDWWLWDDIGRKIAVDAASWFHEAQRLEGVCPVCGGAYPCEACDAR